MRIFVHLALLVIILIVISTIPRADEGSVPSCSMYSFSIFYDKVFHKILVGCSGSPTNVELSIINPESLNFTQMDVSGLVEQAVITDYGGSLLVLLADIDNDWRTEDGMLAKLSIDTGQILDCISFDLIPLAMVVDSEQNYAYVTAGLSSQVIPKLLNVNLYTFEKELEVECGDTPDSIAITNDGSKLYVKNERLHESGYPTITGFYREIDIFTTSNLTKISTVKIDACPSDIVMGYDNRLFSSFSSPDEATQFAITVIDTLTDEIIHEIKFAESDGAGAISMGIDPYSHKLYCTTKSASPHRLTNQILEVDLDSQNYSSRFFTLGTDELWDIAVAARPDFCRIFCTTFKDNKVNYMDIE